MVKNTIKVFFGVVVFSLLLIAIYHSNVPRDITITIAEKKWSALGNSKDANPYFSSAPNWIRDTNGNWYDNNNRMFHWNNEKFANRLKVGKTYCIRVGGWNLYPQIWDIVEEK